ncbi:MAG: type II toxin-antitoxin system VapC family toxin [Chloroflexota bacterium]
MTDVTVDASIWIAAADEGDAFFQESDAFLHAVAVEGVRIFIPSFAVVEVACALSRKARDPASGRRLTENLLIATGPVQIPVDAELLEEALRLGTRQFLRGADALYAATAQVTGSTLVSWDRELIERAGALSPSGWLDANP